MSPLPRVVLAPGRERSLRERHPWVFSGAVAALEGEAAPGETVEVRSTDGAFCAYGAWSPASQIAVRVWTFDAAEEVTAGLVARRVERAVGRRGALATAGALACRLVHAESDGLPGLVVDRYADWLVLQATSAGAERFKGVVLEALSALSHVSGIYERSDTDGRTKEGLPPCTGPLCGGEPPELVEIDEGPVRLLVDVRSGQKTGLYLDQRENRALVTELARGARVLNGFSYTGGFTAAALAGGAAAVTEVESSATALELSRRIVERNGFDAALVEQVQGNAFEVLRSFRDRGLTFDLVILDPPRFAESKRQLERASRGYKDINLLALKLLRPGGTVVTCSCSGHVDAWLFERIVAGAAVDARRDVQVLRRLGQPPDHPGLLGFPEGSYLKGLVGRAG